MPEQAEKSELSLEQIQEQLQQLEKRVAALEKSATSRANPPLETALGIKRKEKEQHEAPVSMVPVLGKAVLAIAGAYLLRAIAESGAAPRRLLLGAGIAYAGVWLVWATRTYRKSHFASVAYGMTSAFVLAPLLWEGTVRFQQLTVGFASIVLLGYVTLSLGLAWSEKLQAIPWIAVTAAVGTALALLVATHELRTLTVALLAIAFLTEAAAWSGRWLGLRTMSALGADCAVGVLGLVMTSPEGAPVGYQPMSGREIMALSLALLLIYGVSFVVRGFLIGKTWTFGEVAQAAVAFALGTSVSLRVRHGAAAVLGLVFLMLAMFCYWGALQRFARAAARWNRRVCMNYAAGLVLAGVFLLHGRNLRAVLLTLAALAAIIVFTRTERLSFGIHGTFYLLAASVVCGLLGYAWSALAGSVPAWPEWSFWLLAIAALLSYVVGARAVPESWTTRVLLGVSSAAVALAVTALAVAGMAHLYGEGLSASRLSMVRTAVTCVTALGLGYAGSRWNRMELGWVAYGAVGLGAFKLVVEDLRFGSAGTLMVSLLFYGLVLIFLPRVSRFGRVEQLEPDFRRVQKSP